MFVRWYFYSARSRQDTCSGVVGIRSWFALNAIRLHKTIRKDAENGLKTNDFELVALNRI